MSLVAPGFMGFPSVGGTIFNRNEERRATDRANDAAREASATDRAWQETMSNSAHQREVKDLAAAGLNPILSGTGGAGASSPGGSTAQTFKDDTKGYFQSNAMQLKFKPELELMQAQAEQANSAADLNRASAEKAKAEAGVLAPKSYIFKKIEEGLKNIEHSGAGKTWDNTKNLMEEYRQDSLRQRGKP